MLKHTAVFESSYTGSGNLSSRYACQENNIKMTLFIRGISEYTKKSDLWEFVAPELNNRLRLMHSKVVKSEILILQDKNTKSIEFHGLVHVNSERAGRHAIKKLNGKLFQGKRVAIREYIQRSWKNDRRENHAAIIDSLGQGNRQGSRRRHMQVVPSIRHIFSSKGEARKLL